jgi:hypothetical protein
MNILLLDIETAPNLVHVWGLWQQNVGLPQIISSGYVLCWSAKWHKQSKIYFDSVNQSKPYNMLSRIHTMMSRADAIVHYNGTKFDVPTLNKEFIKHEFKPPAPSHQIDLLHVVKRVARFESNKLDYVSKYLGIGEKVRHEGHELWIKCMEKDPAAWKRMKEYNQQDVLLLEKLYTRMLPWIDRHPSHAAFEDSPCCPNCGSERYQQNGYRITKTMKYARFLCQDCGTWFRGTKSVSPKMERFIGIPA